MGDYGRLELPLIQKYACQLLEGLEYLHTRQPPVVHRDLKCANLLLTHDSNLKITDFGCSKVLTSGDKKHSIVGSIFWMAPELLESNGDELSTCCDIWSFGCCLLEMATSKHPWTERKFDNFFHAWRFIVKEDVVPEIPPQLSGEANEFVQSCLLRDPFGRASASQ